MSKNKLFSILTIACFISILCIPIGIVLMIYYTDWKKKTKIILSISLSTFYAALIVFIIFVKPSINTHGITLPFGSNSGYTAFDTETSVKPAEDLSNIIEPNELTLPKKVKKSQETNTRVLYSVLFFLFLLFLIIWTNLKAKKKVDYENPYVDTNKYKLPLEDDAKMPMVHYLRLQLLPEEKIHYATETTQKDNEGSFVITNQRVALFTRNENVIFPLDVLEAVSSVTNTVMVLTSGERKYYIFMPENQMKYALAVLRWTVKKFQDSKE